MSVYESTAIDRDEEKVVVDKRNPMYRITLNGEDILKVSYTKTVESVEIEDNDLLMDKAKVVLNNRGLKLTDADIFQEGSELKIWMGYPATELEFMGTFYLDEPQYTFGAKPQIILKAKGEAIRLQRTEKRRLFNKKTYSQIVREIASEYNLLTDIDSSPIRYEQVSQINMTDAQFITKLADRLGYQFFVEDGKLHFHKPRIETIKFELTYREQGLGNLKYFNLSEPTLLRSRVFDVSQFDPLNGEVFSYSTSDKPDEVSRKFQSSRRTMTSKARTSYNIVQYDGTEPKKFLTQQCQMQNAQELKNKADTAAQSEVYIIRGQGSAIGEGKIKARRVVQINGIGKFSGTYYLKTTFHRIKRGYFMEFTAVSSVTTTLRPPTIFDLFWSSSSGTPIMKKGDSRDITPPTSEWV